jgi:hypothetical protein
MLKNLALLKQEVPVFYIFNHNLKEILALTEVYLMENLMDLLICLRFNALRVRDAIFY